MVRLIRSLLLAVAGVSMIVGTFLPWITWNNLFGKENAYGEWSISDGHRNDPRVRFNGIGATGGFKVRRTTYDSGGAPARQFTVISPGNTSSEREVALITVPLAVLALVAAALPFKWLVSPLAAAAAGGAAYPFALFRSWVPTNAPLLRETGMPVDPAMGSGLYVLLAAGGMALLAAGIVWLEPKRRRRPPADPAAAPVAVQRR